MLFKKYKTVILAVILALSLTVSAFADSIATPGVTDSPLEKTEDPDETGEETLQILSVSFPTIIPFVIDPFEFKGKGQVYSGPYEIANHSGNDVTITIDSFYYEFANDTDFISYDAPFDTDDVSEDIKAIYMTASFSNADSLYVLSDKKENAGISFMLRPGEIVNFDFSGTVSYNLSKEKMWQNGDVKVTMDFTVSEESEEPEKFEEATETDNQEQQEETEESPKRDAAEAPEDISSNAIEETPEAPSDAVETEPPKDGIESEPASNNEIATENGSEALFQKQNEQQSEDTDINITDNQENDA